MKYNELLEVKAYLKVKFHLTETQFDRKFPEIAKDIVAAELEHIKRQARTARFKSIRK